MTKFIGGCLLSISLGLVLTDADAVEVLSAQELASHCVAFPTKIESVDGEYCVRYIQGFIDGAVAADERVVIDNENEPSAMESFSERALRTRLPSRSDLEQAAGDAEFCFGDPVPLKEVVTKVVNDLNSNSTKLSGTARDAVYKSLRANYPCQDD